MLATARALLLGGYLSFTGVVAASVLGVAPLGSRLFAVVLLTFACASSAVMARRAFRADACELDHAPQRRTLNRTSAVQVGDAERRADESPEPRSSWERTLRRTAQVLWGAAGVATLVALALALALPVGAYDALGYRLPAIAQWLDAGAVVWVGGDDPLRNGYPLALEVIEAAVFRAFDSPAGVDAVAPLFVLAGGSALAAFAREVGASPAAACIAGALFLLSPMHLLNGPSGYADAAFAGALVFALIAAVRTTNARSRWLDLGLGLALTIGLKPHGFAFAGLALGFVLLARRPRPAALAAVALVAAPGLFFAVRNLVRTGNPIYPLEVQLFGRVLLPGESSLEGILTPSFNVPVELASLPVWLRPPIVWAQPFGPAASFDDRLAGLGYAFLLIALPALFWLVRSLLRDRRSEQSRAVASFVALTSACLVLQPFAFWPRFTSWLWGAGGLAVALLLSALERSHAREAALIALAALALALPESLYALAHVKGLHRLGLAVFREDANALLARVAGLEPEFLERALLGKRDVCRTPWRLGTDDANLDGIVAQLSPRPRMHVIDATTLTGLQQATRARGCSELIAIGDPPFLHGFSSELSGRVETATAFGRCHLVSMSAAPGVTP